MYVDSLACVSVKGVESEWFRIDSKVRQGCIMSPWLFNVYIYTVMKGEGGEGMEITLVLCSESEEDLRAMVGWFVEVCRRTLESQNS